VAISGDYAIVGARKEDTGGSNAGAAYIFKRDGTSWTQEEKIVASDAGKDDQFGNSVAISGDYAIVGAYLEDAGGNIAGAAYIFKRDGTSWVQEAKILASDAGASDYFGYSVSISGDSAIVGAVYEDTGGGDAGAAYIYSALGPAAVVEPVQRSVATGGAWQGDFDYYYIETVDKDTVNVVSNDTDVEYDRVDKKFYGLAF